MRRGKKLNVLFIDNFDSFVFNLVDEFEKRGCDVAVWRNEIETDEALQIVDRMNGPKLVVLSPGPGTPETAGCCVELVRRAPASLPLFGVCLGHQSIVQAFGGAVGSAPEIVHGKASQIVHNGAGLFNGLDTPLTVGRYHSLVGTRIPDELEITARLGELAMAVAHKSRPVCSVQFHPESILTSKGGVLIDNIIEWARSAHSENGPTPDAQAGR